MGRAERPLQALGWTFLPPQLRRALRFPGSRRVPPPAPVVTWVFSWPFLLYPCTLSLLERPPVIAFRATPASGAGPLTLEAETSTRVSLSRASAQDDCLTRSPTCTPEAKAYLAVSVCLSPLGRNRPPNRLSLRSSVLSTLLSLPPCPHWDSHAGIILGDCLPCDWTTSYM